VQAMVHRPSHNEDALIEVHVSPFQANRFAKPKSRTRQGKEKRVPLRPVLLRCSQQPAELFPSKNLDLRSLGCRSRADLPSEASRAFFKDSTAVGLSGL
jgi:hypothetical protein